MEAISKSMGKCLDTAIVTVEGPVASSGPQLDEAGLKYEVIDWKAEGLANFEKYDPKGFKKYMKKKAKEDKLLAEQGRVLEDEELEPGGRSVLRRLPQLEPSWP